MTHTRPFRSPWLLCAMLLAPAAMAWGPTARSAIIGTAIQVIEKGYRNPFKSVDVDYERDVLLGMRHGAEVLKDDLPLGTDREKVNAIGTEIQLLREVRRTAAGSYFAYRMGVLASLVSDVMFPLSSTDDPTTAKLREQVEKDIDAHLKGYPFGSRGEPLEYVRAPVNYFTTNRLGHNDARKLIRADYDRGQGYNGYLSGAGKALLESTINAVADAWYTVLRTEGDATDVQPSAKSLTYYYADQIDYLIRVKRNLREAEKIYKEFVKVNPGMLDAYERVADSFYEMGTPEGRERGVQEWIAALEFSGPERNDIKMKLSQHFMDEGNAYLEAAGKPKAPADSLPNALDNFRKALEYNRSSGEAVKKINQTQVAIAEREERLSVDIQLVSQGENVMEQADQSGNDPEQYGDAIAKYELAITTLTQVSDEFDEQRHAAEEGIALSKQAIGTIINKVLEDAEDRIDQGDSLVDTKKFDQAMEVYRTIPARLETIPESAPAGALQHKESLVLQAEEKVREAERAKENEARLQQTRQAAGGQQAGGQQAGKR
jgi:hypothetical protein